MAYFEEWNKKHHNLTEKDVGKVSQLFDEMISDIALLLYSANPFKPIFKFKDFPRIEKRVNKLLKAKAKELETVIEHSVVKHWNISDKKNIDFLQKHKVGDSPIHARNAEGLAAFQNRKGRKLSSRVWKYTGQFKQEIEMYIDLAIKEGTPANQLALKLKKYVKAPELAQQKYIQKNGAREFVKNIKVGRPGQGVYRSSYKNAQRLARTEINRAYRVADIERWKTTDGIVGYEIKRSKHPYPCDVCEMMQGRYPKNFYWDGNHSNCRCYLVPIFNTDELEEVGINPKLTKWVDENKDKILRAYKRGILPYYLKYNETLFKV